MTLLTLLALSLAVFAYAVYASRFFPLSVTFRAFLAAALGGAAAGAGLRLRPLHRARFALATASFLTGLYLAEGLLFLGDLDRHGQSAFSKAAQDAGVPFDRRTKLRVMADFKREGRDLVPYVYPRRFLATDGLKSDGRPIFPLAGLSSRETIVGNENGTWMIYTSDPFGFNNPPQRGQDEPMDLVVIGDSYAHGLTVSQGQDVASLLRRDGMRVTNLGSAGTGPLMQLGILTEYGEPLRPRVVLWLYYEGNDLVELRAERKSAFLVHYLDASFRQNLRARQKEVDRVLTDFIRHEYLSHESLLASNKSAVAKFAKLWHIRNIIGRLGGGRGTGGDLSPPPLFSTILKAAQSRAAAWGGRLVFVYLPCAERYKDRAANEPRFGRAEVLAAVRASRIPVIDMHGAFAAHGDPLSLFPFRQGGHYTAEGYALVARTIEPRLRADGLVEGARRRLKESTGTTARGSPAPEGGVRGRGPRLAVE